MSFTGETRVGAMLLITQNIMLLQMLKNVRVNYVYVQAVSNKCLLGKLGDNLMDMIDHSS